MTNDQLSLLIEDTIAWRDAVADLKSVREYGDAFGYDLDLCDLYNSRAEKVNQLGNALILYLKKHGITDKTILAKYQNYVPYLNGYGDPLPDDQQYGAATNFKQLKEKREVEK